MREPDGTASRPPPTSSTFRIFPLASHFVGVDENVSAVMSFVKLAGTQDFAGCHAYNVFPEAISTTKSDACVDVETDGDIAVGFKTGTAAATETGNKKTALANNE